MILALPVLTVVSCAIGGDRGEPPLVAQGADFSAGVSSVSPTEYCYAEVDGLSGSETRACASTEQLYLPAGRTLDEVVAGDCLLLAEDGEGNILGHWWGVSEDECEWAMQPTTMQPTNTTFVVDTSWPTGVLVDSGHGGFVLDPDAGWEYYDRIGLSAILDPVDPAAILDALGQPLDRSQLQDGDRVAVEVVGPCGESSPVQCEDVATVVRLTEQSE